MNLTTRSRRFRWPFTACTRDQAIAVCDRIASGPFGQWIVGACKEVGIEPSAFHVACMKDPKIKQCLDVSLSLRNQARKDACEAMIIDAALKDRQWKASAWYLEHHGPDYSQTITVKHDSSKLNEHITRAGEAIRRAVEEHEKRRLQIQ